MAEQVAPVTIAVDALGDATDEWEALNAGNPS